MIDIARWVENIPLIRMELLGDVPGQACAMLQRCAAPFNPLRLRLDVSQHVVNTGIAEAECYIKTTGEGCDVRALVGVVGFLEIRATKEPKQDAAVVTKEESGGARVDDKLKTEMQFGGRGRTCSFDQP